jgi:hypothetical protein
MGPMPLIGFDSRYRYRGMKIAQWNEIREDQGKRVPISHRNPQLDPIIRRVHQVLLGPEVPLGGLYGRVA